jgi:hypothetical protein
MSTSFDFCPRERLQMVVVQVVKYITFNFMKFQINVKISQLLCIYVVLGVLFAM